MKKVILVLLVMVITLVPVLISCQPSEPTLTVKAKATTDSSGVAVLEFDGQKISVFAADETSPSQAVPNVDVSVAEQQGTGLIYAADTKGDFLPELTFLNSPLSETAVTTVALSPAGTDRWGISQPLAIDINPTGLSTAATIPFSELGDFLKDEYPKVKTIVFLSTEEIESIEQSTVSIHTTPFPEVLYAHFQNGDEVTSILPGQVAHAAFVIVSVGFILKVAAGVILGPLIMDEKDVIGAVASRITGERADFVYMPDLTGLTEEEARNELTNANFVDFRINKYYQYLADEKYVTEHEARNLDGRIVSQLLAPKELYDPLQGENRNVVVDIWVGTRQLIPDEEILGLLPETVPDTEKQVEPTMPSEAIEPPQFEPPARVLSLEEILQRLPDTWHGFEQLSKAIIEGCVSGHWYGADGAKNRTIQIIICLFDSEEEIEQYRAFYEDGQMILNLAEGIPDLSANAQTYTGTIGGVKVFDLTGSSPEWQQDWITMTSGIYYYYGIFAWTTDAPATSSEIWTETVQLLSD